MLYDWLLLYLSTSETLLVLTGYYCYFSLILTHWATVYKFM